MFRVPRVSRKDGRILSIEGKSYTVETFGEKNKDITFYVIRQHSVGRGLFSLVSSVLCHLDIAKRHSFVPVVDFEQYTTVYNDGVVCGTSNSWEYYFEPVSNYALEEVYQSKNVILSSHKYPEGYDYSITSVTGLYEIYREFIRYKKDIIDAVKTHEQLFDVPVLGVHYRGQEMRTARGHWFPPTFEQIKHSVDFMLEKDGYNRIFVVTEDALLLNSLIGRYGDIVTYTDCYRTTGSNAYRQYPRNSHYYLLGREILVDALLLSSCHGLIRCSSNVAEFATFVNNGKYISEIVINNGPNTRVFPFNLFLWSVREMLPKGLGGFSLGANAIRYRRLSR